MRQEKGGTAGGPSVDPRRDKRLLLKRNSKIIESMKEERRNTSLRRRSTRVKKIERASMERVWRISVGPDRTKETKEERGKRRNGAEERKEKILHV